ncbi:MAG: M15 family metallopeptidase [Fibromonadaceae bacterium]|nr:M15 family metallopeptidase [Fibromonadaceae bacterium]
MAWSIIAYCKLFFLYSYHETGRNSTEFCMPRLSFIVTILAVILIHCIVAAKGRPAKEDRLNTAIYNAELPEKFAKKIDAAAARSPAFMADLRTCLRGKKYLRELVDRQHPLPSDYVPNDLVMLEEGIYQLIRPEPLRQVALESLNKMSAAARKDGVTLAVSSAYRSYEYQTKVYNRNVRELGQKLADMESAQPGASQHQTGLVVDFYPVNESFANTKAGQWLVANASRFGWSLSFPKGHEDATGYKWESWHYRYVGLDIARFIDNYFDGVQHYALRFLHEWEQWEASSPHGNQ